MANIFQITRITARSILRRACRPARAQSRGFWKDYRGGVAPIVAFAALPLLGSVGAAVDFGHALARRTAMQTALDATALSIVKQQALGVDASGQAQQTFAALYAHPDVSNVSVGVDANSSSVQLTASGSVNTTFMAVMGYSALNITAQSSAYSSVDTSGCVLALDTTASLVIEVETTCDMSTALARTTEREAE